jgi:hypothetical protein
MDQIIKNFKPYYERLQTWYRKECGKSTGLFGIIFYRLPRILARKAYRQVAAIANERFVDRVYNHQRFKNFQTIHQQKLGDHFYIIVMPNILHLLIPCLKLIPPKVNVFLILNGTAGWEENYLQKNFNGYPIFKLSVFPHSSLSHGSVLNLLLRNNDANFGIIDHDLFIFNPQIFDELNFRQDECVIGVFKLTNKKAQLRFPTTHFMFFNVKRIHQIMATYEIDARQYKKIPRHLEDKLASIKIGNQNYLKEYLNYFDTFNLILAMAFYEKLSARILELSPEDLFHVGATSRGTNSIFSTYIHIKFLELSESPSFRGKYASLLANFKDSKAVIEHIPGDLPALSFISQINQIVSRLQKTPAKHEASRG